MINKTKKLLTARFPVMLCSIAIFACCLFSPEAAYARSYLNTSAKTSVPEKSSDSVRILCYGDSNTYGYDPDPYTDRYPEDVRWTGILQKQLGNGFEIIEEGKNGRTAGYQPDASLTIPEDGPEDLTARLEMHRPVDILVIMLGSNDCIPGLRLSAEDVAAGLDTLVTAVEDQASQNDTACPRILLVAPPVPDEALSQTSAAAAEFIQKLQQIGDLYQDVAREHDCLFADARRNIELSELDHLHLTEKGHAQLADLLLHTLSSQLTP